MRRTSVLSLALLGALAVSYGQPASSPPPIEPVLLGSIQGVAYYLEELTIYLVTDLQQPEDDIRVLFVGSMRSAGGSETKSEPVNEFETRAMRIYCSPSKLEAPDCRRQSCLTIWAVV